MSVSLTFSAFAAIHGAQQCQDCGGPTTYWEASTRTHLCRCCADSRDEPGPVKPACDQCGAEAGEHCRRPIGYPCLRPGG